MLRDLPGKAVANEFPLNFSGCYVWMMISADDWVGIFLFIFLRRFDNG